MTEEHNNGDAAPDQAQEPAERPALDPEREARRRRALSLIRTFGDPALKSTAVPVTKFDDALANEIARMSELMGEAMGIGLAATQVGVMHRVLVYRTSAEGPLVAVVNPAIEWSSEQTEIAEEGCLSLPGVAVDVERALYVRVAAQDEQGEQILIEGAGLEARVLQHEIDHLEGTLMIDRTTKDQRREALRVLRDGPNAARDRTPEVSPA
jgi:peptide deformylase